MKNRFYQVFSHNDPAELDRLIENFLSDGRKEIRTTHQFDIIKQSKPVKGMNIPGLHLPPGAQAVEVMMQISFIALLVYEGNAADLAKLNTSKLSIES